jgi:alpha-glucosidase
MLHKQQEDKYSILTFYKDLIKLKKSDDLYTYGTFELVDADNPKVFAYTRTLNNKQALIAGNLSNKTSTLNLDIAFDDSKIKLHNYSAAIDFTNLKPYEAFVIQLT